MESATAIELDGQYRALREEAGVVDRKERGKLAVRGSDAAEFLQGQLTNDVEALRPGGGCYAALLDRKGHMQGDMRVLRLADDELWIDTEAIAKPAIARHLETYKIGTDAQITDLTDERAILSVVGPATPRVTSIEGLRAEDAHREARVGGVECRAVATSHGLDLIVSADRMADVLAALVDAGAVEVTEAAAEILRVESGRPRFDKDMTTRTIPQEAGINERAVSFEKGCYIGQETVARLHYRGKPNRRLAGLRLEAPASDGDVVTLGDREVGTVGTAVTSPAHGAIALAILRREAEPGAGVAVGSSAIAARVVDPPF